MPVDLLGHAARQLRPPRGCRRSARGPLVEPASSAPCAEASAAARAQRAAQVALERAHVEEDHRWTSPQSRHEVGAQPSRSGCRATRADERRASRATRACSPGDVRRHRAGGRSPSPRGSAPARGASARRCARIEPMAMPFERSRSPPARRDPDQRLGVGAHEVAEPRRERAAARRGLRCSRSSSGTVPSTPPARDDVARREARAVAPPGSRRALERVDRRSRPRAAARPRSPRCRRWSDEARAARPGRGSSCRACSWRRSGSPACSRRTGCSRCARALRRRSTGRAP